MLNSPLRPPRPRLTARIFAFAITDVFGLACVAIGASWFASGKGAIVTDFPTSTAEAVACTAGGVVVMFWAAAQILREIAKQGDEMHAAYEAYLQVNHPDKARPAKNETPD